MALDTDLRESREASVMEHMTAENAHDFDRCIAAMSHPRYEVIATGEVFDGGSEVAGLLHENETGFPDFRFEVSTMHHADDALLVEGSFVGTHDGPWRGMPPTHRPISVRMLIAFLFEGDRLVCERTYFDIGTVLQQLGIARDPSSMGGRVATMLNHPIVVGRAFLSSRR
jgi:steroid delta-isomerase-like uncharacterized protein